MRPFVRLRRCRAARWRVRRWHAGRQPTAWRDRRARAGVTVRAGRAQLVLALLTPARVEVDARRVARQAR